MTQYKRSKIHKLSRVGPSVFEAVMEKIDPYLFDALTAKQLAIIVNLCYAQHEHGKNWNDIEAIDTDGIYLNKENVMIHWDKEFNFEVRKDNKVMHAICGEFMEEER